MVVDKVPVIVWICPDCGNYYGSSSTGNLRDEMNYDLKFKPTFPRSLCPQCRQNGKEVHRTPHSVIITMTPQVHSIPSIHKDHMKCDNCRGKGTDVAGFPCTNCHGLGTVP